jgi:hypothetical protein
MLASKFTGTSKKWFTFSNGVHVDSLDPATFQRWYDFLSLYVAKQTPVENAVVPNAAAPVIYQQAMGLPATDPVTLPPDPIQTIPTYDAALAAFEKLPQVQVLFENGAGTSPLGQATAGNPYPTFEQSFPTWPIPGTTAQRWYLGANDSLNAQKPSTSQLDSYTSDAKALPLTDFSGPVESGGLWGNASQWSWHWQTNPSGTALSYVTSPLASNTTVVGAGALYLWVRSSTPDVDL